MNVANDDGQLAALTMTNLKRMSVNLSGAARVSTRFIPLIIIAQSDIQKDYEEDFVKGNPSHYEYILRLQQWRDKYEKLLESRPRVQSLDLLSHYLTEFQYGKSDDIEVPGQYTEVCNKISKWSSTKLTMV